MMEPAPRLGRHQSVETFGLSTGEIPLVPLTIRGADQPAVSHEPAALTVWIDFADFYRIERAGLVRALALTLGDTDLAAEAVDEAMTRAYQRWRTVQAMGSASGWVYRVALNWSRSVLRSRRRRQARALHEREAVDGAVRLPADPAVRAALAALDVKHRSVVVCRYLLGFSLEETAAALDIPAGTVKSRLHRASHQLRVQLDHLREEHDR